ncbi:MAG: hypothetical protein Q4D65_00970 [Peptostreptococcaceae bacterium]|nr:hypothetical protein [Peptostreptococcaceae bacterium]
MDELKLKALELVEHLLAERILEKCNLDNMSHQSFGDIILSLRTILQETYPETKLKKMMKSVHYANGFSDEELKQSAFLLDEIEQYLAKNKFLDHDMSVNYFNDKITADGFVITPTALVVVMMESLLLSKGGEV